MPGIKDTWCKVSCSAAGGPSQELCRRLIASPRRTSRFGILEKYDGTPTICRRHVLKPIEPSSFLIQHSGKAAERLCFEKRCADMSIFRCQFKEACFLDLHQRGKKNLCHFQTSGEFWSMPPIGSQSCAQVAHGIRGALGPPSGKWTSE